MKVESKGFTLIEMVVTIVIGSIIMLGIAGYVQVGVKGFVDANSRQRIQTQAQFVLEKLSREIRHAVPNSFRITNSGGSECLEFVPTYNSGYYFEKPGTSNLLFVTGEQVAGGTIKSAENLRFVINPTRYEDLFNPPTGTVSWNSFSIDSDLSIHSDDGDGNAQFYSFALPLPLASQSIAARIYLYKPDSAIRYCIVQPVLPNDSGLLTRNGVPVEDIDASKSAFNYTNTSLQIGGIVYLKFAFEQNGEESVYQQDVQVLNVP
ncbi:prepilin-type N-terminal cleavage/methylation domain-containing protein [Vibrio parahaemolyticus]|nr:prepilin-type N-terminal cleavage/methylation domain-containing protein [Vibrio parahaemolyticus]ELB2739633.1 prepilin-type N-terminal cleavage/methylation domain-containing protein [Vibrio parahaemolyticus]